MPSLPSPLSSKKYRLFYITGEGLLLESKAVAPLTAEDEAEIDNLNLGHVRSAGGDGNMARITKRHCIYIRRAQEFVLINTELVSCAISTPAVPYHHNGYTHLVLTASTRP